MSILTFLRALLCPPPCMDEPVARPFDVLHPRTGEHIRTVLRAKFPKAQIRIADSEYSTVSVEEFNKWIHDDMVSARKYYSNYFDCDNFARWLRCTMFKINLLHKTEIAMCYTEGMSPGGYHAFNIFVDYFDNVYVVEPQNDHVILCEDSKYLPDFIQL